MNNNLYNAIATYFAAWNAVDLGERNELLAKCFLPTGTYIDPHIRDRIKGIEEMSALITEFRARFKHRLEPTSSIDLHHQVFRVSWQLIDVSGSVLSQGLFCGEMDTDETAKISRLIGFLDRTS
jgi:hypothetical protein